MSGMVPNVLQNSIAFIPKSKSLGTDYYSYFIEEEIETHNQPVYKGQSCNLNPWPSNCNTHDFQILGM